MKKNAFCWDSKGEDAFVTLKNTMTTAPIIALPNFQGQFIIETDASGQEIRVVLMQWGHPIAYINKTLAPKHQGLSTCKKELLALMYAVEK